MPFLMRLPTENSYSSCILPNGAQLVIIIRLRVFSGMWTVQLCNSDGSILTDECPLRYNTDLFKQYIELTSVYGIFSVEEDVNAAVPLEDSLNKRLCWDYPPESEG